MVPLVERGHGIRNAGRHANPLNFPCGRFFDSVYTVGCRARVDIVALALVKN